MKPKAIFLSAIFIASNYIYSYTQNVSIHPDGSPAHASALLDIQSSNKGLSIPHVALTSLNAAAPVLSPANSLLVYNTALAGTGLTAVYPGYYYWNLSTLSWRSLSTSSRTGDVGFGPWGDCSVTNISDYQPIVAQDGLTGDFFGNSISAAGNIAVIGAPEDDIGSNANQGSVYVFYFNGLNWIQQQKLTATDGSTNDYFGKSVAISESYVIVGSPNDSIGSSRKGSAYIFSFNGASWVQQQKIFAADGSTDDDFGRSVSVYGNTVLVGAPYDDTLSMINRGSAYVFRHNGTSWNQFQKLKPSDGGNNDLFGFSLNMYNNSLLIGAVNHIIGGCEKGAVYSFSFNGIVWQQQQKFFDPGVSCYSKFGNSVDIQGTTAIISTFSSISGNYIFRYDGTTWTELQKLVSSDIFNHSGRIVAISDSYAMMGGETSAEFFENINNLWVPLQQVSISLNSNSNLFGALSGDRFLIGESSNNLYQGRVLCGKLLDFNSWESCSYSNITGYDPLAADDGSAGDYFGNSVSMDGNYAITGAPFDNFGKGAAYIYQFDGTRWIQHQKLTASDGLNDDNFGQSVFISGDYAIVGASGDDIGANTSQGSAYIFFYNGTTWTQQQKLTASNGAASDFFGACVSISGNKAVIGAPFKNVSGHPGTGTAYLFTRSGVTWTQSTTFTQPSLQNQALMGWYVSISSDRIAIGAPGLDLGSGPNQGGVYIYLNTTPYTLESSLYASDGSPGNYFGISLSLVNNLIMIGAPSYNSEKGAVYAFTKNGGVWSQAQRISNPSGEVQDFFGTQISVNGNFALIGTFKDNVNGLTDVGSAYLYQNVNSLWVPFQHVVDPLTKAGDEFGYACGLSGQRFVISSKNAFGQRGLLSFGKIQ